MIVGKRKRVWGRGGIASDFDDCTNPVLGPKGPSRGVDAKEKGAFLARGKKDNVFEYLKSSKRLGRSLLQKAKKKNIQASMG